MSIVSETHHPKRVARSGAIYTLTLVIQKILSFTYFSFIASALGPASLGRYTFALSFAAFFSLAVDFGFVPMAIRSFSRSAEDHQENFRVMLTLRLALAGIGAGLMFLSAFWLGYDKDLLSLLAVTALIMVMDAFTAFFYTVFRSRQNLFYESLGTIIFQIIVVGVGLATLQYTRNLQALLWVIAVGSCWHAAYSLWLIIFKARWPIRPQWDFQAAKRILSAAVPFFLAAGFIKAYNTIDTILLKNMASDTAVGLYAIPAKVVFTFPFLAMGITAAVYPAMSNYAASSRERLQNVFSRTLQLLFTISLPIAVGIFLLAEPIIERIWPEFREAIPALRLLIWAVVFLFIEYPFGSLLNATGNERRNTWNRGVQLASFIVFNVLLIPIYGFMGATYTALGTSVLIVFLGALSARRLVAVFNKATVIVLIKLGLASGVMAAFVWWVRAEYSFLIVIPAAALVYFIALLALRVYGGNDWAWLKGLVSRRISSEFVE